MSHISAFIYGITVIDLVIAVLASAITFGVLYYAVLRRAGHRMNSFLINSLVNEQDQYIAFLDYSSKILLANKSFEDLIGLPSEAIIGKKLDELPISINIIEALTRNNDKIIEGKAATVNYVQRIQKNKEDRWLEIQKRTLLLKNPDVTYILIVASDISDKKKVEERLYSTRTEYKTLVDAAGDIIYRTNFAGDITFINGAIYRILGYTEKEVLGTNIKELVLEEDRPKFEDFMVSSYQDLTTEAYLEFRVRSKTGEIIWLGQVTAIVTEQGDAVGFQGAARDVSDQKLAGEKLKKAKEMAEEASSAKSNFISSMSHEFRTPLNAILGYSQILERNHTLLPEEKEHIKEIKKGGEQLLGMVNDILELVVLDNKYAQLHEEEVMVASFMDNFTQRFHNQATDKGLIFRYERPSNSPEVFKGDMDKISVVLKNLLENAIKFTSQGEVCFSYDIEPEGNGKARLECLISDTGVGIAEKDWEHIFHPFWQKAPLLNKGTGLGLTLCQRLVDVLNGELTVQSKADKGTQIRFLVPVHIPTKSEKFFKFGFGKHTSEKSVLRKEKPKALIVDDLGPNRTIARIILHENGFDYAEAEDGAEALAILETFDADVVLMDINMPVMDGIDAMLEIRNRDWKFKNCPIIAVTAGAKGGKTELLKKGFSDYIQKPFKEEEFLETINTNLYQNITELLTANGTEPPEQAVNLFTVDDVSQYILTLDEKPRDEMEEALRCQDFDAFKEMELLHTLSSRPMTAEFRRLIQAVNEYDYLFANKVLKSLRTKKNRLKS